LIATLVSLGVMLIGNGLTFSIGPDLWINFNFIQIARSTMLISHKNDVITGWFRNGLGLFALHNPVNSIITSGILSFTD
jgi:hypothetical protein